MQKHCALVSLLCIIKQRNWNSEWLAARLERSSFYKEERRIKKREWKAE